MCAVRRIFLPKNNVRIISNESLVKAFLHQNPKASTKLKIEIKCSEIARKDRSTAAYDRSSLNAYTIPSHCIYYLTFLFIQNIEFKTYSKYTSLILQSTNGERNDLLVRDFETKLNIITHSLVITYNGRQFIQLVSRLINHQI